MPHPKEDIAPRRPAWFWWALANLLALCFAVTSWVLTLEIFGRPDVPSNYQILRQIDRAPHFKLFSPKGAPEGRVFDPPALYAWFFDMGEKRHGQLNSLYRRNYMRNFDDAHAVTYLEGSFEVLESRKLGNGDFVPHGIAVRAQALVRPDDFSPEAPYPVIIELILPWIGDEVAHLVIKEGTRLSFAKSPQLPVVMHVGRYMENDEPTVQVTLIPIGEGAFRFGDGNFIKPLPPVFVEPEGALRMFKSADD